MTMERGAPLVEIGDLSAGIWQALVTSAAGLCVSIPSFAGYNFLLSRVERITLNLEHAAEEIYRFLVYDREKGGAVENETV